MIDTHMIHYFLCKYLYELVDDLFALWIRCSIYK